MLIKTIEGKIFKGNKNLSILQASLNEGLHLEYSCKNGQCGACKTTLIEGEVDVLQDQQSLSQDELQQGKILSCCCAPKTDIIIDAEDLTALKDIEVKTLPARIHELIRHTNELLEIRLRLPPTAVFYFLEGQFIDVIGPEGVRRSYSIANSATQGLITLFVKNMEGGIFSRYWFEQAKVNDLLRLEGPKGTFFLRGKNKHFIFLATGTGIAPVKAMLDQISESPDMVEDCQIDVFWGNRHKQDFIWQPDYTDISVNYIPVLSRSDKEWLGEVGYVQGVVLRKQINLKETEVYACGSLNMIEATQKQFVTLGLNENNFYSDAFVSS
ncbi:MAG: 2Fe-2S iron-sulfur cluster-binding protein [Ghiorsea sp.]